MTNFDYKTPSAQELRALEQEAHAMRALYVASFFKAMGAKIRGLFQSNNGATKAAH